VVWIRSAIFNLCFFSLTAVLLIAGLPTLLGDRHTVFKLARLWSRSSLWLLDRICGLKVEFRGAENVPAGAFILAAKHQSMLETFALVEHVKDFSFILKRELTRIPLFGWYLKRAEMIAIDRKSGRAALEQAIERSRALLAEGRSVFIFPEGTRTKVGAEPNYKMGVAHIYASTGARCLPVALNTGVFWPRRSFRKYPGRIVIEFLPIIEPGMDRSSFLKLLQTRIETASAALTAESVAADAGAARRIAGQSASA
jgi:1-acyl-sn-glycerol-3-phosphate acyltransferase